MFTAKIKEKNTDAGVIKIYVDFTDGTKTITEWCIPQNEDGFKHWVKSRLEAFNSSISLEEKLAVDATVDVTEKEVAPPVLTQAEIDRNTWLTKYAQWVRIKTTVVDTGIVPISNAKVTAMLADLKTTLKAEYIDYI